MDIVTLGAALNGSAEYVNSHFKGGSNIQIVDNPDGTQTINASGEVSAEDTVARADIAAIKDGETLDSFGDVETALATKANTATTYTKTEVDTALDNKVDKVSGKGLSTNDYTTTEKTKLAGIAEGAEVNEIESIKVNNTTINPDANKVVNITVPTTAADVSALPDTTKYAAALSLTINSSTFVMTGQLKDQNGDNLGTAQTIDLPLESVVVGGSYNSQTKKVVLTLQNGNTIDFSVADLVSGLQTELSTSNKLNPAFIEYDSTHRAVSDTEKSAWNSKQNALTTAQLAAVNSGIDSTKVAQIETNKNNISTVIMKTVPIASGDLNNVTESSYAIYTDVVSNKPTAEAWYIVKTSVYNNNIILQEATALNANAATYTRIKRSGNWQAWKLSNLNDTQLAAVESGIDSTKVAQIETNKNNISSIGAIIGKQVYSAFLGQDSGTAEYQMKTADFQTDTPNTQQCGIYIVYVISWSTTPVVSIYTVGYSGGTAGYNSVTKIVGTDSLISVDENRKITYTGKGKISIYAMR